MSAITSHKSVHGISVGQAVIFADDTGPVGGHGDEVWPIKGRVYHVRGLYSAITPLGVVHWLTMQEIIGSKRKYMVPGMELGTIETPWCIWRFRPATKAEIERDESISIPAKRDAE